MSRDYKPEQRKASKGSSFLAGLLFGFLLGVLATVALTMFIKGDTSPFEDRKINAPTIEPIPTAQNTSPEKKPDDAKPANDFDFYTILPETESTVTEKEINNKSAATLKNDTYFLQVGAFQKVADADNMKAKLALQGFEAVVQTATVQDKGTWHRVRVGPLKDIKKINKIRSDLTANDFKADLIKVHTETKSR